MKMKVITKRFGKSDTMDDSTRLQRMLNQLKPGGFVPSGIYRFYSFKEADQWMIRQMAKLHVHQKLPTSYRASDQVDVNFLKTLLKEEKKSQSSASSLSRWQFLKKMFFKKHD